LWSDIWKWIIDNYIFHAIIVISVFFLIFFPGRLYRAFGKFKKIKAGAFELQTGEEIDPDTPCPYKKSRDITFGQLRDVDSKVDKLTIEVQEIMAIVKNMSIDQQKSSFYDEYQPDAERLAAGLKYIYQGGNGFTKPDVIKFAEGHKDIYNALTRVKPELRLSRE